MVYYLVQERLIFVRHPLSKRYRYRFSHAFEERWITGADGAELHGLYFPVENAAGVVLYFHGNTGTLKRWGKPDDLAGGYLFLSSPIASYVTGSIIAIDGGYLAV